MLGTSEMCMLYIGWINVNRTKAMISQARTVWTILFLVFSKDLELLQYVKNSAARVHTGAITLATHQPNPHQLASVQVPYHLQNPPSHPQTPLCSCSLVSFWSNTTNLILVLKHSPALQPSRLAQNFFSQWFQLYRLNSLERGCSIRAFFTYFRHLLHLFPLSL